MGTRDCVGTELYFAPEVIKQNGNGVYSDSMNVDEIPLITYSVDVWALGIIAYELLSGTSPFAFAKQTKPRLFNAILYKEPDYQSLNERKIAIDFIQQCLRKNPQHRPTTKELLDHQWFKETRS